MMKRGFLRAALLTAAFSAISGSAFAEGKLNILAWGNVVPPGLLKEFEAKYQVKVTVTDYDSSDTALAKIRQGGHGMDAAIVASSYLPIWIKEGLLLETNPSAMVNGKNVKDDWRKPPYDPEGKYSVPYEIGVTGVAVNTSVYKGDPDTSAIFMDPPAELAGKINVVPAMDEVMFLATRYVGGEPCSTDKAVMRKVRDKLVAAKPKWVSMNYSAITPLAKKDISASVTWNGASLRARLVNPDIKFGFPKEGYPIWVDSYNVLKGAANLDNAKLFQNFLMDPKVAASISAYTRYANAIKGSEEFMPAEMKNVAELNPTEEQRKHMTFIQACPEEARKLQSAIWTEIQK
jgi:spermidine/putrescine transport system substrate-binding protein